MFQSTNFFSCKSTASFRSRKHQLHSNMVLFCILVKSNAMNKGSVSSSDIARHLHAQGSKSRSSCVWLLEAQHHFSGESLDPPEYRRWKLWVEAIPNKTWVQNNEAHTFSIVFLLVFLLEAAEHLTFDLLTEEQGDKQIWLNLLISLVRQNQKLGRAERTITFSQSSGSQRTDWFVEDNWIDNGFECIELTKSWQA